VTDTPETTEAGQQTLKMQILGQFIRDMSFENIAAQKAVKGEIQPDVQVQVNLDAKKRTDTNFEVGIKLTATSKNKENGGTIFMLELDYAGIFLIEGVSQENLHPFLLIECPRQLFPFLRRIVSDITRDGGYPPLNLDNIDFVQLYRQELSRRAQAETAGTA
jgi:preprotein translocase subunit SecB